MKVKLVKNKKIPVIYKQKTGIVIYLGEYSVFYPIIRSFGKLFLVKYKSEKSNQITKGKFYIQLLKTCTDRIMNYFKYFISLK